MKDRFSSDSFDTIYLLPCSGNAYNSVRARCRWQVNVGCICGPCCNVEGNSGGMFVQWKYCVWGAGICVLGNILHTVEFL